MEEALASAQRQFARDKDTGIIIPETPSSVFPATPTMPPGPYDTLISRLCGTHWRLNSDNVGQLRFLGPTSSLHLVETVSSPKSTPRDKTHSLHGAQSQSDVSSELQEYLLGLFWDYLNDVLQVVHKDAFLHDMRLNQTRYFSKLLLCCILACAACISDRPAVRFLALESVGDEALDEQSFFLKRASTLLDAELRSPRITTVQSLQLLSVIYCCRAEDTKGWLYSGLSVCLSVCPSYSLL